MPRVSACAFSASQIRWMWLDWILYCTTRTRETVQWAREAMGGNGILLEHDVARFFADSEALYSYEGTREINSLIVGRAITGYGAFV